MKHTFTKWNKPAIFGLIITAAAGLIGLEINSIPVQANNTAQVTPFSQNWTNAGLITTNDDWSAVPGIVGYLGDIAATSTTNVDPRTLLADYTAVSAVDVIANQTNPDTLATGGVAEFDTISNPTIALQGSGTADAPHIIVYLNTTGKTGIKFACSIRDIDGSADDAVQPIDVQYRVGGTGNYTSVDGGYIADATTAGTATQVTPLNLSLPTAADNKALVEIRVITTNANGSDEWVGVDDINVTATGGGTTPPARATVFDFTGTGRTSFTILSPLVGGQPIRWKVAGNPALPGANQAFIRVFDYGIASSTTVAADDIVPDDYRGDKKYEVAVRRRSSGIYYVSQFPTGTSPITLDAAVQWGTSADVPGAEGDYDGDGKSDYTVARANSDNSITYFMLLSATNTLRAVPFGLRRTGVLQTQLLHGADFTGDGRDELVFAQYSSAADNSRPITYYVGDAVSGAIVMITNWGDFTSDVSVSPADYTGDGRADLVAVRQSSSPAVWYVRNTATGASTATPFGVGNSVNSDLPLRGDYDGDGRQDVAVWRPSNQTFYFINSATGTATGQRWGDGATDVPLATFGTF